MSALLTCVQDSAPQLLDLSRNLTVTVDTMDKNPKIFLMSEALDPSIALNNCWVISDTLCKALESNLSVLNVDYESLQVTGIETPAGCHYGLLVTCVGDVDNGVIIDFSASQFDDTLPFPLIMDMWSWQQWYETHIGRMGEWSHDTGYWGE